jgi:hypothetical protein
MEKNRDKIRTIISKLYDEFETKEEIRLFFLTSFSDENKKSKCISLVDGDIFLLFCIMSAMIPHKIKTIVEDCLVDDWFSMDENTRGELIGVIDRISSINN